MASGWSRCRFKEIRNVAFHPQHPGAGRLGHRRRPRQQPVPFRGGGPGPGHLTGPVPRPFDPLEFGHEEMNTSYALDKSNAKLLGVCAGLARSTGWDLLALRLGAVAATIFLLGPIALVAYVLTAWLADSR